MIHHDTSKEKNKTIAVAPPAMKFVSVYTMAVVKNKNDNGIAEISDEELLEMALKFEKEYQE